LVGPNPYGPKHAGIFAGRDNRITVRSTFTVSDYLSANHSVIAGGNSNLISGHTNSFIAGGELNMIECDQGWNSIVGGYNNKNTAAYSTIIGGQNNQIGLNCGDSMSIIGGEDNLIEINNHSTIIGGQTNSILGSAGHENNVVIGGNNNTLDSVTNSVIIGGLNVTGTSNNTVYVPDLVIYGLVSTDPLATDVNGKIVAGASDSRLKTNVKVLDSALDKVKSLRGVSYEWTEDSNMGSGVKKYGLIAQEVQKVIPDMVRERSKGDGMLALSYTEIVPWLIEAIKELSSGATRVNSQVVLETQTVASEDNNIDLNYGGNHETSVGGGITVLDGVKDGVNSEIKTDENGNWIMNPPLATKEYTPTSTNDEFGKVGDTVWDDGYIYIKTNAGWKRSSLENF